MTGGNHANNRAISVWFLCKSCGFTFHFQHVNEFLEHKKQVHFSEFEKIRCIVFEEKLDDNQEHHPEQAPEMLDSNLFHVDKTDFLEGEVECFWEPETKLSASISTDAIISQDSPSGNEFAIEDPKLLSSYVLARRLTSQELQLAQKNKIEEPPRPAPEYLNISSLQPIPTILTPPNDKDELPGNSAIESQENNTSANPKPLTFGDSNPNRIVSFSTDPTEDNVVIVEISDSKNVPSCDSPNDSSSYQQLSTASRSAKSVSNHFTVGNILSDPNTLKNVLNPNSQTNLDPSMISSNNSIINEIEDAAVNDVTQEIYVDFETVVHSDEVNLKPEADQGGLTINNKNCVSDKSGSNTNTNLKYNPYVLVKRLKLTDLAICPEKDAPSEHSDSDNDIDYQPYSPQDSGGSDSDLVDDESRTKIQDRKRDALRPIRGRSKSNAFVFPPPENFDKDVHDQLTLKDWLLQQMETTDSSSTKNIILLDPDPTIENVGPVTSENPISCKLCSKKLTSEVEVKVHVKHCWLRNKRRHRFCVVCAKSYCLPRGLKRHNVSVHGTGLEKEDEEKKIFKCQYCTEQFEDEISCNKHKDMHPEKLQILKPFTCKFCNKAFRFKCHLRLHLIAHSNDRPFKCDLPNCSFTFKRIHDLVLHKRSHGNPRKKPVPFKFPYLLSREANNESDDMPLADWIAKQTEEVEGTPRNVILLEPDPSKENVGPVTQKNYISCKLCCEQLTSESRVKIHVTHCWFQNKDRHRYCVHCNKQFYRALSFKEHCVRIHGTDEEKAKLRRFKCQQCPKAFWERRTLLFHLETHKSKEEQNRPFVCETCGLRFLERTNLQKHLQTHSSDSSFKCLHPNCARAFKTRASRRKHMKTHSESRPYNCKYPGYSKSFKTSRALKGDEQFHESKRYECTHGSCNKKFSKSDKLKRHIKVRHTEEGITSTFECDVCHKIFALKSDLIQHAPVHLNLEAKPYKCGHEGCEEACNCKRISGDNAVNPDPPATSDPISTFLNKSNENCIASFSTDPPEENVLTVADTESQKARSCNSPTHTSLHKQLSNESESENNALNGFATNNISNGKETSTEVLSSSQAILDLEPSRICMNGSVTDQFEDLAANDVTEEMYVDFETGVYNNEVNLKSEVESNGLTATAGNENCVKEKSGPNANINLKYNPYVLVKRLKLTDHAGSAKKGAPSENPGYGNDDDYQPCSSQDSSGSSSDSDFDDDELRCRNQLHEGNSSSPIQVRQGGGAFIFPSPESDGEVVNDPLTLKDWLLHQMESTDSNVSTNIILLDPDPTVENVGVVASENAITCKLCSQKLTSEPEVKVHVKHCWLRNKKQHRFCVTCAKSYCLPRGLKRHNKMSHGAQERKVFKCQYCPEQFESEASWNRHQDTHPEKSKVLKPCEPKICNKSFCSKSELKQHLISHSNDRPFKCDHPNCSFTAKRPRELKNHKISHENPGNKTRKLQFKFPYVEIPEANNESDDMPLVDWIAKQTEEVEGSPPNVILLKPDPTKENVGPITNENYISCKLCCEKLTSEARVKVHATHCWFQNKDRHRYCVPCNKQLYRVLSFKEHCVRIHGSEEEKAKFRRFKCQQCPKAFWERRTLLLHLETHKSREEQNRPFVCETCGSRFLEQGSLQKHLQTHSSDRPYKCLHPNCSQAFKTKLGHYSHMKSHSDSRPHECQYPGCSKLFKTSGGLKLHSQIHEGKRCECTHGNCSKKFATSRKLKLHIKVRHTEGGLEKKFECDICHKRFATKQLLKLHSGVHLQLEDKPFKCSYEGCKKAFHVKRILDEHERKHTGELPFVCHSCGKAYAKEWSFRKHVRVHENTHNKHSCHICPRKFPGTWELKQHLLIHEKGKQFICSQCGKECMTKANLNIHQKTHSEGTVPKSGKRKNSKKVETSSESESLNESSSDSEGSTELTESSTQSDEES